MTQPSSRFFDVLVTRTVRALEQTAGFDDDQAMRAAAKEGGTAEARLIARAWDLANRVGIAADLQRLRNLVPVAGIAAAFIIGYSTYALLMAVTGDGRSINAVTAFRSLLGLHALTLILWFVALALPTSMVSLIGLGLE